jgi:sensor histidine kinase regulating citrate/malate metabolism
MYINLVENTRAFYPIVKNKAGREAFFYAHSFMSHSTHPKEPAMKKIRKNKLPIFLYVLCALQLSLIAIIITSMLLFGTADTLIHGVFDMRDFGLLITLAVMAVSLILTTRVMSSIKLQEIKAQIQSDTIRNMETLNNQIRAQRHDFLNHIQVVYSLVELEEYAEASAYLNKLLGDVEHTGKFMKTGDAAVNALLAAKYNDAARRGIAFQLNIASRLEGLNISGWELCRVLGNLIDNAIYAAEGFGETEKGAEKKLTLSIAERDGSYEFAVENTGEPIDPRVLDKLFMPGFTTKKEEGHGMGLYIVRKITESNGGSVGVTSANQLTRFTVKLPMLTAK